MVNLFLGGRYLPLSITKELDHEKINFDTDPTASGRHNEVRYRLRIQPVDATHWLNR